MKVELLMSEESNSGLFSRPY